MRTCGVPLTVAHFYSEITPLEYNLINKLDWRVDPMSMMAVTMATGLQV